MRPSPSPVIARTATLGLVALGGVACGSDLLHKVPQRAEGHDVPLACALECDQAPSACAANGRCVVGALGPACVFSSLSDGAPCTLAGGGPGVCGGGECLGCLRDADCDDGAPCTADTCADGMCQHSGACAPSCEPGSCPATTDGGCGINGRCPPAGAGCLVDPAPDGTTCVLEGGGDGVCAAGQCIESLAPEAPYDSVVYGAPPPVSQPWCPSSGGVGLPGLQQLNPVGGASCPIIGAAQQAYGNCPIDSYPLEDFESWPEVHGWASAAPGARKLFDLRLLKFEGIQSLRFKLPEQPTQVVFNLSSFAYGMDLSGYRVAISDTPCALSTSGTVVTAAYCDGSTGLPPALVAAVGYPSIIACRELRPGHIYYFTILGGGPADVAGDGVIEAGDRLLITIEFVRQ